MYDSLVATYKVDGLKCLVFLIGPLDLIWYMVRWGSKSKHHKNIIKIQKWGTNSSFLMEPLMFATSNTCVRNPKNKIGEGSCFALFWGKKPLRKFWVLSQVWFLFEEYASGARRQEMHVHIDGNQNENILNYIKSKHVGIYNSMRPLWDFMVYTQIRDYQDNLTSIKPRTFSLTLM